MYKISHFSPREYQENIHQTSLTGNTLACLPTGTGKTKIAILTLISRLNQFPEGNTVIISPTKPLSSQIAEEISSSTDIPKSQITLLTGETKPEERKKLFNNTKVIVATPQTIQFDLENKRISLENTSLLIVDECHRSKQRFANTIVAKEYVQQAKNQRILALTASPGATKEKVSEVCSNLFIENIELRTEEDSDIATHLQKKSTEDIRVELPKQFKEIKDALKSHYQLKLKSLKKYGIQKPDYAINKTDLILYQKKFQQEIKEGNFMAYRAISTIAEAIKTNYALDLIETQTPSSLRQYFKKLSSEKSKAAKNILKDKSIQRAMDLTKNLVENNIPHPKLKKLKEIISKKLTEKPSTRAIIFANYRLTVNEIKDALATLPNAKPIILIGKKEGLTQKKQLSTIENFNKGEYNFLICTSIGEEGLSIGSLDLAVFYDHTGSEIRKIQRAGRVARIKPGNIINLITKDTRDEALFWTSKRKETKMHKLLKTMKNKLKKEKQSTLTK
jgi:ERCC4-related helicase